MELTWVGDRSLACPCPLCESRGPHPAIVHYRAPYRDNPPRNVLRCSDCRSMFLDDLSEPTHIEDSSAVRDHINFYVDFARHAFGWRVAGVDPGVIARTGQKDLDPRLRPTA